MGQEHSILEKIITFAQVKTTMITYGEYNIVANLDTSISKK